MDFSLDTIFSIKNELFYNYRKQTPNTIKILDTHSLICFLIVCIVKGTMIFNNGINQFSNDASFLMALGSMIMTSKRV